MRRVVLGETGIETSCLGFGCASLGSRVAADDGLHAMGAAYDAGVTWFDFAPLYGGGRAEEIAGQFLKTRRGRVQVCSKVGLAPAARSGLKAMLMPVARRAVRAVPQLRGRLRGRGLQAADRLPLTPELIRNTLETSLRRLGTDYLDLYALHDAEPAALADEGVLRALENAVETGKARAVAVASDAAAAEAAIAWGSPFGAVQLALGAPGEASGVPAAAAAAGMGCIVHSVFGVGGAFDVLKARVAADPALRERLGGEEASGASTLGRLMLERAFALNPGGVVLVSMFSERSCRENLAVAVAAPGEPVLDKLLMG